MGKASAALDKIRTRPLTPAEIRARQAAREIGDKDVKVTSDGQFVRAPRISRDTSATATTSLTSVVGQASRTEWD